jgi:predicted phosphodiesterase
MTRLAVLADIHGNLPALRAAMDDMAAFRPDHVIVAGDVVNWGPFSAAVTEIVTREGWAVMRGNNEFYLLDYNTPRQPPHWKDYTLLPWLHEGLAGHWHNTIAAWPDELRLCYPDAPPARVIHGLPGNPWRGLHPLLTDDDTAAHLASLPEETVIAAHTHLAMERRIGRWHLVNPGTVGAPLDGDMSARYLILDGDEAGWRATFRSVPYDTAPLFAEFERQRFVERFGITAGLVVKEFITGRQWVFPFVLWRRAHAPGQPESRELLEQFLADDVWAYTPPEYHVNL